MNIWTIKLKQNCFFVVLTCLIQVSLFGCAVRISPLEKQGLLKQGAADKVTVCHKGKKTLSISRSALDAHLRHGDFRGPCY